MGRVEVRVGVREASVLVLLVEVRDEGDAGGCGQMSSSGEFWSENEGRRSERGGRRREGRSTRLSLAPSSLSPLLKFEFDS